MKIDRDNAQDVIDAPPGTNVNGWVLVNAINPHELTRWGFIVRYILDYDQKYWAMDIEYGSGNSDYCTLDDYSEITLKEVEIVQKLVKVYEEKSN